MTSHSTSAIAWRGAWLRSQLDHLPPLAAASALAGSDWIAARTRRMQALDRLVEQLTAMPDRPTVRPDGGGARVRMMGITCTSTMGIEGALKNWLTRAQSLVVALAAAR